MDKKRNPALVLIFSFISFGIYFLWWSGKLQADIKEKTGEGQGMGGHIAGMLFGFGIYWLIWSYCIGKRLHKAGAAEDRSTLYLILSLLGIGGLVNTVLQVQDVNKMLDSGN